ncbi:crispr-associated protein [Liquorilactobacillus capillatus DSM 19910]|uniref:Crispr-associated protein n=2 Tax=Liquorilactobacillus capillatus TaxID=480931 RepID=A0A0R1LXT4_9LACO|nr:crispr-associated protein [Liquorilactobacillus capillatus DSM 19910]
MASPQAQSVWPVMMAELQKPMLSQNGEPTYAEIATYAVVRLYAIHQQSIDTCVYSPSVNQYNEKSEGVSLFVALAGLRQNEDVKVALDRRVQPLLATTNVNSVINSLTHLVAILKGSQRTCKVDYARLANDLFQFQISYEQANRVRLNWGRQYFYSNNKSKKEQNEGKKN